MDSKRPPMDGGRCDGSDIQEIAQRLNTPFAAPPQAFSVNSIIRAGLAGCALILRHSLKPRLVVVKGGRA